MMKRFSVLTVVLAAAALVFLPTAFAQGPCWGGHPGGCDHHGKAFGPCDHRGEQGFGPRMAEMLELSDAQRDQMKALREGHFEASASLRGQLKGFREQMRELWSADAPDKDAILAKMGEMSVVQLQLRQMQVGRRLEMRTVLTPEQLDKLQEKRARMRELHEEMDCENGGMRGRRGHKHGRHHGGRRGAMLGPGCPDHDLPSLS